MKKASKGAIAVASIVAILEFVDAAALMLGILAVESDSGADADGWGASGEGLGHFGLLMALVLVCSVVATAVYTVKAARNPSDTTRLARGMVASFLVLLTAEFATRSMSSTGLGLAGGILLGVGVSWAQVAGFVTLLVLGALFMATRQPQPTDAPEN